ncbi:hypothetical protein B9Z65_488 [Elsinoe australis]|uniref:Uncharacterized protein n=1 Tax=Elsinoe australis TaxID=40998 RepID=A0A2P8AIN1_9PEZI|nr:hypothetical protein B9Z65_488 [Elsinoe australis]
MGLLPPWLLSRTATAPLNPRPHRPDPFTPKARKVVFPLLTLHLTASIVFWLLRCVETRFTPGAYTSRNPGPDLPVLRRVSIMNIVLEALLFTALAIIVHRFRKGAMATRTAVVFFSVAVAYWLEVVGFAFWRGYYLFVNIALGGPMLGLSVGWLVYFGVMLGRVGKMRKQEQIDVQLGRVPWRAETEGQKTAAERDVERRAADAMVR